MLRLLPVLLLLLLALPACRTAKKVAVTSFRVIDAPANYVRQRLDESEGASTTTTTTTTSDVSTPGRPVASTTTTARPPQRPPGHRGSAAPTTAAPNTSAPSRSPAPSTRPAATTEFPTARPVPGKPGYVYSLDPNGGIVDVTGYKSGDKAKDPYTQKIFIVP